MGLAATVKAMAAAGFSGEQIADVVARMEEERLAKSRQGNARRQAEFRRRRNESNGNNGVTPVTSVTAPSPLLSSPTPPTNNPLPRSSLRSVSAQAREEVFHRFWAVYPKRTNRKAALAKLETAMKAGVDPEKIIAAAERYAKHVQFTEQQFIKAPDAWLNAGKYDDELPAEPPKPPTRAGPRGNGFAEMLDDLADRGNGPRNSNEIRDITPTGASEPGRGDVGSGLFEPAGKPSGGGEILDFRPASPDTRRSPPFGSEAARTADRPHASWRYD